ncbi:MAG: DUF975 family protein [Firmicutes bacterium]|nr:DUF975 family protein [Bacillota bacterium]
MENHIVIQSASKIREVARAALNGYWKQIVVFAILYYVIGSFVPQILNQFFNTTIRLPFADPYTGQYMVETVGYGGAFYSFLIGGPLSYGFSMFMLSFFRRKQCQYGSLFEGFSQFGKAFFIMLITSVKIFLWSMLFVIPGIIAALRYSMAYYVMVDHPEYTANQCIEASKVLMIGNKGRYFYLQLTFIGWYILASILGAIIDPMTSGLLSVMVGFLTAIPVMVVNAYSYTADVVFYELAQDNLVIVEHDDTQRF